MIGNSVESVENTGHDRTFSRKRVLLGTQPTVCLAKKSTSDELLHLYLQTTKHSHMLPPPRPFPIPLQPGTLCQPISAAPASLPLPQSRRSGEPPIPIEVESLLTLVVPAPSSSAAPETSPEAPAQYPSMSEVLSSMWCEEDDEEGDGGGGGNGGGASQVKYDFLLMLCPCSGNII